MPEILQVFTIERRLFAPEVIPWPYLITQSNQQRLRERYKFSEVVQAVDPQGNPQIVATVGEFSAGGLVQAIEQFTLGPIAIQFQISADSDKADQFFDDLKTLLTEIDPRARFGEGRERAKTYQTIAIVKLSVPFDALLSEGLQRYISEVASPRLDLPDAKAEVILEHLSWSVRYATQSIDFLYLPKVLTIEPRRGSALSERLYYTQSPTDFRTHKELLRILERQLAPG